MTQDKLQEIIKLTVGSIESCSTAKHLIYIGQDNGRAFPVVVSRTELAGISPRDVRLRALCARDRGEDRMNYVLKGVL